MKLAKKEADLTKVKFSKEQILQSKRYANRKDLLNAVLKDDQYTFTEVDKLMNDYLKGKVI